MNIIEQLDLLAEYQAQADLLAIKRRELMEAVKIPAEVQAAHDEGVKRKQQVEALTRSQLDILDEKKKEQLKAVVIPPEIQAALDEIDQQRRQIELNFDNQRIIIQAETERCKAAIDGEFSAKVKDVYNQVEARRSEIAAEFGEKVEAVEDNIARLTAEIKAEVIKAGKTIKGAFYQAVFVKGRVTWNTDMLDGMIVAFPELSKARKEGQPSVTLRKI